MQCTTGTVGEAGVRTVDQPALFDSQSQDGAKPGEAAPPPQIGRKRLRHAARNQVESQECSLGELLAEEHEERIA
jgi:hypothetical protein